MTEVYLPLKGDGKQPAVRGWADPDYTGVEPKGRVGRRADGLVIVDCDSEAAYRHWLTVGEPTMTVKTPRGYHLYYLAGPDSPTGPAVGVFPGTDIRAGSGSYVVAPPTPGYELVGRRRKMAPFTSSWLPRQEKVLEEALGESWDVIPDGRRNATLTSFAGAFRKQGMDVAVIYQLLLGINEGLCDPPLDVSEVELISRSVGRYEADPNFEIEIAQPGAVSSGDKELLTWLSAMEMPPPAEWWWKPYLPKGRLVLLDGSEGIGKGLFCVNLALLVSLERRVLWMTTEDDPEEDIQKRLKAAGWDPKSHGDFGFFNVDPKFPTHEEALEELIAEHGAGLVVMDPGRSFLAPPEGSKGMSYNDEAFIRPGLESLNKLAKRSGCTVVFVHHWNKDTQASVSKRAGGSGAFAQVVRHRLTMAWHGNTEEGVGAFEVSKSNIGPKGHVYGYSVRPNEKFDTAVIELTEPLPYSSLGEWMRAVEQDIPIDMTGEVMREVEGLAGGAPVDMKQLAAGADMEVDELEEALAGLLRKGPRGAYFRLGDDERAG